MIMRIQLNITLKYLIMNQLKNQKRIYLNAKKRYNIIQKDDKDDKTIKRRVKSNRFFVFSFFRSRKSFFVKF